MSRQPKAAWRGINLVLTLSTFVVTVLLLEAGMRVYYALAPTDTHADEELVPLHILCECPTLYRLNPAHPEISSQGLRDREFPIPKPGDIQRILILGDSIAFGINVAAAATYPKRLEAYFDGKVEVVNSGVQGYTAYNELQYYLHNGRQFQADIVVVSFSPNDVVNPRRHINYAPKAAANLPDAAIPNHEYDQNHVVPTLEAQRHDSPLENFALYEFIDSKLNAEFGNEYAYLDEQAYAYENGRRWPTFITGEDTISIKVLLDYDSTEWQWLRDTYDQLATAVDQEDATMVILMLPLAYQLDEAYPYLPQELMARYCAERNLYCLDLLPALRHHNAEDLFLGEEHGYKDIWHLNERGHQVVGDLLGNFLVQEGLVQPATGGLNEAYSPILAP